MQWGHHFEVEPVKKLGGHITVSLVRLKPGPLDLKSSTQPLSPCAPQIKNDIGVAPFMQLRTCVIKIVTFKGGHPMW